MKKLFLSITTFLMGASAFAAATGPDYSALTSAVNFTTTTAMILVILAALAVVYVALKGGKIGLSVLR